jgi:hypothetical protein
MNASGVEQSTFATGAQAFNDQALSRLGVQIMGSENTSYATQEHLNNAKSVLQSTSIAASQATDAALSETTNFLSQVGKAMSSGEDFHKSVNASEAKSLQNFKNYVNDIQQSTGLNEAQAFEAAVGASSGALQFVGIDIRGGFSSSTARSEAIQAAKSIAEQTNYSDSLDKVVSAAQSFSEAHTNTKNAELGRSAAASLTRAKSLREETSIAQNTVDTLSKDISYNEGKSLSVNKDLTQSVLEYIAHQPVSSGPNGVGGQIGYDGARQILEGGGAERDAYLKRFQEENPQYQIQSINAGQVEAGLSSTVESASNTIRSNASIGGHHQHNSANVLGQAKSAHLDLHATPESRRGEIIDSLKKQDSLIEQRKQVIDAREKELKKAEQETKDKSLAGSVLNNSLASITPDRTAVFQHLAEKDPAYRQYLAEQQQQSEEGTKDPTSPTLLTSNIRK